MREHKLTYLIIDSVRGVIKVHPPNSPYHSWFQPGLDISTLLRWHKKSPLPNILLPLNGADGPQTAASSSLLHPLLSYCNYNYNAFFEATADILFPKATARVYAPVEYVINETLWLSKKDKGWFRGNMNAGAAKGRFAIVNESRARPDLLDLGITTWHPSWDQVGKELRAEGQPMDEAVRTFRYIVVIDGCCDAWRLQELLGKNVVVIKPFPTEEAQWYSRALLPWVHFVPVALEPYRLSDEEVKTSVANGVPLRQRSDIVRVMQRLRGNPKKSLQILHNANLFYRRYLTDEARECYVRRLFSVISSLYAFNVTRATDRLLKRNRVAAVA